MGIAGAHCLFSPLCCSDSVFQKAGGASGLWGEQTALDARPEKAVAGPNRTSCHKHRACVEAEGIDVCGFCQERSLPACSLRSRAIYFAAYSKSKEVFNGLLVPNSGAVHMSSAGVAGELARVLAFSAAQG